MAQAWYLAKPVGASTNFVDISIPAPVAIAGEYDFTIGFEVQLTSTDLPVLHAGSIDTTVNFYFVNSSGNLDIRTSGNSTTVTINGGTKTDWNIYSVRHFTDSGVPKRQVFYNGVLKATYTLNNIPTAPITYLFKAGSATRTGNLKTLWLEDVNAPTNNKLYDANLSGGVGTTLPPDGTLNGAMAWVEYDDGTGSTTNYDAGSVSGISVPSDALLHLNASSGSVGDVVIASSASLNLSCSASALSEFSLESLAAASAVYSSFSESLIGLYSQGISSRDANASSISQLTIQMSGGSLGPSNYDAAAISGLTIDSECGTQRSSDISSVSNFGLSVSSSVSVRFSSGALNNLEISFIGEQSRNSDVSAISNISVMATGGDSSDPIEIGVVRFNAGIIPVASRQSPYNIPASILYGPGKTQRVIRWS